MKKIIQKLVLVTFFLVSMSACSTGLSNLFKVDRPLDTHKTGDGTVLISDTPSNWNFFISSVDPEILREVKNLKPWGGKETWNEYWLWRVEGLSSSLENIEKYCKYPIYNTAIS